MFSAAEKSKTVNRAARQAQGHSFFRKAGDRAFLSSNENSAFFGAAVQPKLNVSQPDDPLEKEADKMAEKVMRKPDTVVQAATDDEQSGISRKPEDLNGNISVHAKEEESSGEEEEKKDDEVLSTKRENASSAQTNIVITPKASLSDTAIIRNSGRAPPLTAKVFKQMLANASGTGSALTESTRQFMESRFRANFRSVRIHTDSIAETLSGNIQAQAFTHGHDIYFNNGKYSPNTATGGLLLAHELSHVLQQERVLQQQQRPSAATSAVPAPRSMPHSAIPAEGQQTPSVPASPEAPAPGSLIPAEPSASTTKSQAPKALPERTSTVPPSPPGMAGTVLPSKVPADIPRAPASPAQDPTFRQAKTLVHAEAKKQKWHVPATQKRTETENASAMEEADQRSQSSQEKSTAQMEQLGASQQQEGRKFSAESFKSDLMKRINAKQPESEDEAKAFAQKPPLDHFEEEFSGNVAKEQAQVTDPLEKKAEATPSGGVVEKKATELPKPRYAAPPAPVDARLATAKPKTDQEISTEHESDRLDNAMQENRLDDDQLAESREPSFIETLKVKQQAKQAAAEAPQVYREKEKEVLQAAEEQAGGTLTTEMAQMSKIHRRSGGQVFGGQQKTETATEKRQREIRQDIDGIYNRTVNRVKCILECMAEKVKEDFAASLKQQTDNFNERVRKEISDYYGDWRIDDKLFGPADVVVLPDGSTRAMTLEESFGIGSVKRINPDVYRIFVREKNTFLQAMNEQLDIIAANVEKGLTAAYARIQQGRCEICTYKNTLKGEELIFATQLEGEVEMKFSNLESSIDDTREDLLQTLATQYKESVNQLEKTFNEINDELKKSWIDRAIEFVVTVGKTIFQLAELLLSILVRVAHLVWDIVKHPIRFFETLVSGLKQGISMFIDNIGTHLQEAFWTWITGATPVKNIRLTAGSGLGSLFDLVMQVLSLGPADLRAIVDKVLGKEFMQMIDKIKAVGEKVLEPVIILLTKGPLAFWEYIKDTLGSMIQSSFDRIRETVFNTFVESGIKWIAGFFIPGGGFVKIVKAIFSAFQFVAENLENIRHFFDAIFDSMDAAVQGRTEGVANKVLLGLKTGVVLALDFLAKQLGLSKIIDSVHKIIHSLRKPIVNAIEWLLMKVKPFVIKLMKKGKELLDKAKKAGAKALGWLGFKEKFVTETGVRHSLYIRDQGKTPTLMIESSPQPLSAYLKQKESDISKSNTIAAADKRRLLGRISHGKNLLQGLQALMNSAKTENNNNPRIPQMILELITILREVEPGGTQQAVPAAEFNPGFTGNKAVSFNAKYVYKGGSLPGGATIPKNHAEGTPPQSAALANAWQVLVDMQLSTRWVKFHILNESLGGIGIDSNMIPAPTYLNNEYRDALEDDLKQYYNSGLPIWIRASANYRPVYNNMFVHRLSVQAGAMKFQNEQWVEDPGKRKKFNKDVDVPETNIFNINAVLADRDLATLLVNMSTITRNMLDILRQNQPPGGYRYIRQMERVLASSVFGRDVLSFDPEVVDPLSPDRNQSRAINDYRRGLASVNLTFN